jgi:hypothetical protein
MKSRLRAARFLAPAVVSVVILEMCSWLAGCYLQPRFDLFYTPPADLSGVSAYLVQRDEDLGWPSPGSFGTYDLDASGSRLNSAFPLGNPTCVSLYGDSFTWAQDVTAEEAWGNQLSLLRNCRVANYGVNGYGTDQAYLRFTLNQANKTDQASVVVLAHMSENIRRNVNQYRHLLTPPAELGLKPRYVIDAQGALQLVPLLRLNEAEFREMVVWPERYLHDEYFLPNGPSGNPRLAFPYTLALISALGDYRIRSRIAGMPGYAEYYRRDHPSNALEVTAQILAAFHQRASAEGQQPVVAIIPNRFDLAHYQSRGEWVYQPLMDRLAQLNVPVLNFGPGLLDYLGQRNPDEIFSYQGINFGAHYNPEGNRALARVVYDHLVERGLAR